MGQSRNIWCECVYNTCWQRPRLWKRIARKNPYQCLSHLSKAHRILRITHGRKHWCTTERECMHTCTHALTHSHAHARSLTPFVCFGREGSVPLSSASTCSLLSWKKLNKYRANKTNHSSHALWHPFLVVSYTHITHTHIYIDTYMINGYIFIHSGNKILDW